MLKLYHYPASVCAQKVRLVLEEKRLDWTSHIVDLLAGEQFAAGYRALNPGAVVPTLVDGDRVVLESAVICEYLDDAIETPALRPADVFQRARMRLWTKRVDEGLHQACGALTFAAMAGAQKKRIAENGLTLAEHFAAIPDEKRRERQRIALEEGAGSAQSTAALLHYASVLAEMSRALEGSAYLTAGDPTLADFALLPYVLRLQRLAMHEFVDRHAGVMRWFEAMTTRASFTRAISRFDDPTALQTMHAAGQEAWTVLRERL